MAWPVGSSCPWRAISWAQACRSSMPAAEWMALSMHPWQGTKHPSIWLLAALTMASTARVVMSPCQRYSPGGQAGDVFFRQLRLEKGVLNRQHLQGDGVRGPGVHQGPEEAPPVPGAPGDGDVLPAGALSQQGLEEEVEPFFLGHGEDHLSGEMVPGGQDHLRPRRAPCKVGTFW